MIDIEYPKPDFSIQIQSGKEHIFDKYRRKWVRLTPEEWVRQNTLNYLTNDLGYPASLISVEKQLLINGEVRKRFDIVIYQQSKPWLLIECKELGVPLTEIVLEQVLSYNIQLAVPYFCITNGKYTYLWKVVEGKAIIQTSFPNISI